MNKHKARRAARYTMETAAIAAGTGLVLFGLLLVWVATS